MGMRRRYLLLLNNRDGGMTGLHEFCHHHFMSDISLGLLVWPSYWSSTSNGNLPRGKQLPGHYCQWPCHHWKRTQGQHRSRQNRRQSRTTSRKIQYANTDSLWTEDNCLTIYTSPNHRHWVDLSLLYLLFHFKFYLETSCLEYRSDY